MINAEMKPQIRAKYDEAVGLLKAGKVSLAKELLEELKELDTGSLAILIVLGGAEMELGLLNEAESTLLKAVNLAPRSEAASLGLCVCLMEMGKNKKAIDEIRRFMSLMPDSTSHQDLISEIYEQLERRS